MLERSIKDIRDDKRESEAILDKLGCDFVNVLFATLKIAAMYEPNNNRYLEQSNNLRAVMDKIFAEESDFTLVSKGGYIYLSDVRLKSGRESDDAITYFLEQWPPMGISGISISEGLDPRELDKFIFLLSGFDKGDDAEENYRLLRERLDNLRVERISFIKYSPDDEEHEDEDETKKIKVKARKTFFSALAVAQNNANQARNQNSINVAKTKRAVQGMIDVIIQDDAAMLELTTLRDFDDYTYVHSVNVCVLALLLGYHLGLDRKRLSHLGVGALLHDIGKMRLPVDLINKPDTYDDNDWQLMRKHPVFGVKFLYKTRAVEETTARASTAIFEHHISFDGSGYPELLTRRSPSLYARMVSIADTYNAMTSGRVYHRKKNLPDEVVTKMVNRIGTTFDPLLLKIFINAIGVYPVGTVVTMSSNQIGIVARNNPADPENPEVKIIGDQNGLYDSESVKVIDLSKEPGISITKMLDGDEYNIDNAAYLDIG